MRILGVDIPEKKRVHIALSYIYGIGITTGMKIVTHLKIDDKKRAKDLTDEEIAGISDYIRATYKIANDLKKEENANIRRKIEINCYAGKRIYKNLPLKGRTHANGKTAKREGKKRLGRKG